jgi:non-ribosomal peptide synthase protein (TIGR01720 family)
MPKPQHWNQAFLLEAAQKLEPDLLETAVVHLLRHHDALRLRFTQDAEGQWRQTFADLDDAVPFSFIDLSDRDPDAQRAAIEAQVAELQASLDLAQGPLLRVAYFSRGEGQSDRLFLVIHHLAVDGVSWRILFEDLQTAYAQLLQGREVRLPAKTTSFKQWAENLLAYAQSGALQEEAAYWTAVAAHAPADPPTDYPAGADPGAEADTRSVVVSLNAAETLALLQEVPAIYGTEINDVLLTALAQTFADTLKMNDLLVDLEGHGRSDLFDDVDIARTVGWFTTLYPVQLRANARGSDENLKMTKEQLRRIPNHGLGFGLLRYLQPEAAPVLAGMTPPRVAFNYLGRFDQLLTENPAFRQAPESAGASQSPRNPRQHWIDVNGGIGEGRLRVEWRYSSRLYRQATIEQLAQGFIAALQAIINQTRATETAVYTPSDFADVELSSDDLDALLAEIDDAF